VIAVITWRGRRAGYPTSPGVSGTATGRRTCPLAARWRRMTGSRDGGAVTAELVIAMPLLLGLIMLVIQAGVFLHATHIAQAAANRAAAVAAAHGSTAATGQQAGQATLAEIGHSILTDTDVRVTRSATEVRVEIVGVAATVVPGVHWQVKAVVVRPTEVFVAPAVLACASGPGRPQPTPIPKGAPDGRHR